MDQDRTAVVDGASSGEPVDLPAQWWAQVRPSAAVGEEFVVRDPDGNRFVLVPEERYRALEDAGRSGDRSDVTLTAREREILQMIAEGCPGSVVAGRLGLAPNTVAQHLASVRRKYGVRSSAEAARTAQAAGLIG